jgi:hypothetical protein
VHGRLIYVPKVTATAAGTEDAARPSWLLGPDSLYQARFGSIDGFQFDS